MKKINIYWSNFVKYRYLLIQLVISDFKVKYRRSILGILWSLLNPILMMIVFSIIFSALFESDIPHFAVYVLTGRIIWDLYSQATASAMLSIVNNESLIKKVYVPKYIFPLSKSIFSLVNTFFSILALIIVALFTGGVEVTTALFLLPFPLIYTLMFATGISFILAAYTVFFRDLEHLYQVLLTAWMYFTPLFYPVKIVPEDLRFLVELNPVYWTLEMFRQIIDGKIPSLNLHMICFAIGAISLLAGVLIFRKKQDRFILYV
ncbi:ABC-2 type transporter [Thermobacillus xylanilyticus]|jgi:ABC-2 type transport system permease protein|uniref:Transport permease protein n=1 Tax=Thermobacillus xylanilyticus TaxID=76633 RepID=A0ABN7S4A4_THEXY|nr:ABC transporter permease [Thermobacillus xylanilyticus]CAG5088727.1 ABC-2 type transporter [Thermobacillus xylanilyticus]